MSRSRFAAAALAVATIGGAALFATLAPAQAAAPEPTVVTPPAAELVTPVTTSSGTRTLIVDPTTDLAATGATIKVEGKGFSTDHGLYVAVCAAGSGAPEDLSTCLGGSIPAANTTTAWAHITKTGQGGGGVKAAWGPDGAFSVSLALPSVTDGDVNCVTSKCSLYTASDDDAIRDEDNAVPLTFKAPPSSSSSVPPTAPGTAIPQQIGSPSIAPGGTQLVVFSGFRAGEQVNLTLFSEPITLSPVTADSTGVARAEFVVPADFVDGTHRLEAIGQSSRTVGVASFQVVAPPVSSPSPTPSPSPSPSSSASSSPPTSSSASSSSAAASSPATTSSAAATGDDSGSGLWWLWLILAIVVIAGIITGIVAYRRKQEEQRLQEENDVAAAAAAEQAGAGGTGGGFGGSTPSTFDAPTIFLPPVQPEPGGPPPGADPYGLLSGRDHPDNPSLYSSDSAGPTEVLGSPDYQQGPGPYGQPLGYGGPAQGYGEQPPGYGQHPPEYGQPPGSGHPAGPPTQALPPTPPAPQEPAGPPSGVDGPGTRAWAPDFDDTDTGSSDHRADGSTDGDSSDGGSSDGGSR